MNVDTVFFHVCETLLVQIEELPHRRLRRLRFAEQHAPQDEIGLGARARRKLAHLVHLFGNRPGFFRSNPSRSTEIPGGSGLTCLMPGIFASSPIARPTSSTST